MEATVANVKHAKPGVVYFPTLPPYMNAQKLRHLLEKYGRVGRIYLTPEDPTKYLNRVKSGGCKKECFTEGWVEFLDKSVAKEVADALNARPIGGKKRHNFYRDDVWCMRYLHRFTWNDLMEHRVYQKQVNQKRLQTMLSQQKKEDEFFLEAVAKKKDMDSADLRRKLEGKEEETKKRPVAKSFPQQTHAFIPKKRKTSSEGSNTDLLDALAM
jgi:ESF2/ABP1 family protein